MPSHLKARHHLRSNGNIRAGASVGTKHTIGGIADREAGGLGLGLGGISSLKTINTLQVALQKHKGGDGRLGLGISVKEVTGCNSVPHVSSHRLPR